PMCGYSSSEVCCTSSLTFFFFNDPPTTAIYTLSLHDALPICVVLEHEVLVRRDGGADLIEDVARRTIDDGVHRVETQAVEAVFLDRKSTRLNSSHLVISYAVFCLKKKKKTCHSSPRLPSRQRT